MTLVKTTDMTNSTCPKCGHIKPRNELECPQCGIIYKKYEIVKNRRLEEAKEIKDQDEIKKEELTQKNMNKTNKAFKPSLITILIILLVLCVLIGSAYLYLNYKHDREYLSNLRVANSIMALSTIKCVVMSEQYSTVWREAINDKYNFDFNDDIRDQRRKFEQHGDIEKIEVSKQLAEELLQKLNQPNDLYPQAHRKIVELYGVYSQLHSLAQSPSGTLMTYNKQVNELQSEYIKIINELKVLLPKEK